MTSFDLGLAAVDYAGFGEFGPLFQENLRNVWAAAAQHYARLEALGFEAPIPLESIPLPDLGTALTSLFDRDGFWCKYLLTAGRIFSREKEIIKLWQAFRSIFSPALSALGALIVDRGRYVVRTAVIEHSFSPAVSTESRVDLNRICFGPYTKEELDFITKKHPQVFEFGAGSGYLLRQLRLCGADAIGVDNNTYGFSDCDSLAWNTQLRADGHLLIQENLPTAQQLKGRTQLLSWPMPGTRALSDILQIYERCGGRRLLLKLGGFLAPKEPYHFNSVLRFFETLVKGWQEQPDSAHLYSPWKLENNLFAFERRR